MMANYDVVLSFAGEDRAIAKEINDNLKRLKITTFYDDDHIAELWGSNLAEILQEIYCSSGRYCLLLLSKHYLVKHWTRHERRAAISRMIRQKSDYLLVYILDETKIEDAPGINPDTHYLTRRQFNSINVVEHIATKLNRPQDTFRAIIFEKCAFLLLKKVYGFCPNPSCTYEDLPATSRWAGLRDSVWDDCAKNLERYEIESVLESAMNKLVAFGYVFIVARDEVGTWFSVTEKGVAFIEADRSAIDLFS